MSKKAVKIIGVLTGTILSLIMLSGCKGPTKKEPSDLAPDTVTYSVKTFMPGSYDVYVINSEEIIHYDFFAYWGHHDYEYFSYPLPAEDEYTVKVYSIEESEWEEIVNILNEKNFDTFPEDFSTTYDVMDGGFTYIEVLSGENRYFSGGYCVEEGKEPERESYKEISIVLYNIVTNAKKHPKKTN